MKVVVIGAGLAGLTSIKSCLEEKLDVVCYESGSRIGGTWCDEKLDGADQYKRGRTYEGLVTNTSKETTCFSDLPMPAEWPSYITRSQFEQYINSYADQFGLRAHIKLEHNVLSVNKSNDHDETGSWQVQVLNKSTGVMSSCVYDAVLICSGINGLPYKPHIEGLDKYNGTVLHSKDFTSGVQLAGKSVLVIGNASSGCDIAYLTAEKTDKTVYLMARRGVWIVKRKYDLPIDMTAFTVFNGLIQTLLGPRFITQIYKKKFCSEFDYVKYGLMQEGEDLQKHQFTVNNRIQKLIETGKIRVIKEVSGFLSDAVILHNNEQVKIDALVLATGYETSIPYLSEDVFDQNKWHLYEHVWPVDLNHGTLAIIGHYRSSGAFPPSAELQARWAVQVLCGKSKLPSKSEMKATLQASLYEADKPVSKNKRVKINPVVYTRRIAQLARCHPDLGSLHDEHQRLDDSHIESSIYPVQGGGLLSQILCCGLD